MKKLILFFAFMFLTFSATSTQAFASYYTITKTYTFSQYKKAADYIAKKAGMKVIFLSKPYNLLNYRTCEFQAMHGYPVQAQACNLIYYNSSWFYRNKMKTRNVVYPQPTQTTYKYMLLQFLANQTLSIHNNKVFVFNRNTNAGFKKLFRYMAYGVIEKMSRAGFKLEIPFKKSGYNESSEVRVLPYHEFKSVLKYNDFNPATKLGYNKANTSKNKLFKDELKHYINFAVVDLQKFQNITASENTYGLSKQGLESLIFSVVNPQSFYDPAVSYLKEIPSRFGSMDINGLANAYTGMAGVNFISAATIATLAEQATALSNMNNQINGSLNSIITKVGAMGSNRQVVYSLVADYYTQGLVSRYGDLKTSFLKDMGVPANLDVSYNTILYNSNLFLGKINESPSNLIRFHKLFNRDFNKKFSKKQLYIPFNSIRHIEGAVGAGVAAFNSGTTAGRVPISLINLNYSAVLYVAKLADYPVIDAKSVNFYSFVYYLLRNIYFSKSKFRKKTSEKLLKLIVFKQFNKAVAVFNSIPVPVVLTQNGNKIRQALYDINANHLTAAKNIIESIGSYSWFFNNQEAVFVNESKKTSKQLRTFRDLYMLYLCQKYKDLKTQGEPWNKLKEKGIVRRLRNLKNNNV